MNGAVAESVSETQETTPRWIATILGSKFLVISIAVHLLFGVGAAYWAVQRYH